MLWLLGHPWKTNVRTEMNPPLPHLYCILNLGPLWKVTVRVFPASDLNKSLLSFTYTHTCTPQQHFLWKTECHFLNPEARSPSVLIWGAKTGNSAKLLPLPPWTATGAADRGQGLFGVPLMHCSWKATAHFHAVGMIPERPAPGVSLTRAFQRKWKRNRRETLTPYTDLTSISKRLQTAQSWL